jgi:hypothetical protein
MVEQSVQNVGGLASHRGRNSREDALKAYGRTRLKLLA